MSRRKSNEKSIENINCDRLSILCSLEYINQAWLLYVLLDFQPCGYPVDIFSWPVDKLVLFTCFILLLILSWDLGMVLYETRGRVDFEFRVIEAVRLHELADKQSGNGEGVWEAKLDFRVDSWGGATGLANPLRWESRLGSEG